MRDLQVKKKRARLLSPERYLFLLSFVVAEAPLISSRLRALKERKRRAETTALWCIYLYRNMERAMQLTKWVSPPSLTPFLVFCLLFLTSRFYSLQPLAIKRALSLSLFFANSQGKKGNVAYRQTSSMGNKSRSTNGSGGEPHQVTTAMMNSPLVRHNCRLPFAVFCLLLFRNSLGFRFCFTSLDYQTLNQPEVAPTVINKSQKKKLLWRSLQQKEEEGEQSKTVQLYRLKNIAVLRYR